MADMKPITAADSRSACRRLSSGSPAEEVRSISARMIPGTIWNVEALPTPLTKKSSSTMVKNSGKRSEEHTSELQSLMRISYAVFCLKKKNIIETNQIE